MGYAYVCIGNKCARACDHDQLVRALCKIGTVQAVRCQKIATAQWWTPSSMADSAVLSAWTPLGCASP